MSTGRSTEQTLARRLEALVPAAGSSFDKAATWEKLQQQLEDQKKKKRSQYSWLAAAAMLLILFSIYQLYPFSKKEAAGFTGIKKIILFTPVKVNETFPEYIPAAGLTVQHPSTVHSKEIFIQQQKPAYADTIQTPIAGSVITLNKEPHVSDTAAAVATNIIPANSKKKLPVVYNNEITRPDIADAPRASGSSITLPGLKKDNTETIYKTESNEPVPAHLKNRWFPFNNSAKPKE